MISGYPPSISNLDVSEDSKDATRILVLIRGFDEGGRICRYIGQRAESDPRLSVSLLFLVPPIRDWQVLRFRTEAEVRRHSWKRAETILAEAAGMLREKGFSTNLLIRESDRIEDAFSVAEEADCSEIVALLPQWYERLFGCDELRLKRAARVHQVHLIPE